MTAALEKSLAKYILSQGLCPEKRSIKSMLSIHIRVGDSKLISHRAVKKYGFKRCSSHNSFPVKDVEKVFQFVISKLQDPNRALFFLASDSARVKKRFEAFFGSRNLSHLTQVSKVGHFCLLTDDDVRMNAIDITLLSYSDVLVHKGSTFPKSAHELYFNPLQVQYLYRDS